MITVHTFTYNVHHVTVVSNDHPNLELYLQLTNAGS